MKLMFRIRLRELHRASGKSISRVARDTDTPNHTVWRYVHPEHEDTALLSLAVIKLARYYGVDWKDVVEIVEVEE